PAAKFAASAHRHHRRSRRVSALPALGALVRRHRRNSLRRFRLPYHFDADACRTQADGRVAGLNLQQSGSKRHFPAETDFLRISEVESPHIGDHSMSAAQHPNRSPAFRLLTIACSGIGGLVLGIWGLRFGFGDGLAGMPASTIGAIVAGLCALAAASGSISFFAGVDESLDYVMRETHFDKLTGALARSAMVGRIAHEASRTIQTGEPVYLIDVDIDRFKQINDAIGYTVGDELVKLFAERLKILMPKGVTIGRIGAGEFAILCPDEVLAGSIDSLVGNLIDKLMQPYQLSSHLQSVSVSVGLAAMPKDGTDPLLVMRRSNLALQHARASGVGNWAVFHTNMGRVADFRQWVESELHAAFARGDFDLHYQPQLDLLSGRVVGYEALIRWHHPER